MPEMLERDLRSTCHASSTAMSATAIRIVGRRNFMDWIRRPLKFAERNNARVNRDAATRTGVGLVESDIMGGTTIRRLIGHEDFTASVQRFVIRHFAISDVLFVALMSLPLSF